MYYQYPGEEARGMVRLKFDFWGPQVHAGRVMASSQPDDDFCGRTTWLINEGPPLPGLEFSGQRNTVVLSYPNYNNFHTFLKGRGAQPPLYMPVWTLEELQACGECLFPRVEPGD